MNEEKYIKLANFGANSDIDRLRRKGLVNNFIQSGIRYYCFKERNNREIKNKYWESAKKEIENSKIFKKNNGWSGFAISWDVELKDDEIKVYVRKYSEAEEWTAELRRLLNEGE